MKRICLDTMVTIVDSGTFVADFSSREALAAQPQTRPTFHQPHCLHATQGTRP